MARIEALLGKAGTGDAIALAPGASVSWGMSYGVAPQVATFETGIKRARRMWEASEHQIVSSTGGSTFLPGDGPLTLTLRPSAGPDRVFKGLYALEFLPGSRPDFGRISFTDSRWLWRSRAVERAYNVTRRTGDVRLVGGEMVPIQNRQAVNAIGYRPGSLKDDDRWKAQEVLEDILKLVAGEGRYVIPEGVVKRELIDDRLMLRDSGDVAVARVLAAIPGLEVFQNADGLIQVANRYDGSEGAVAEAFRGAQTAGDVRKVDRSRSRFRVFRGYSPRRSELRFDFEDTGGEAAPSGSQVNGQEPLSLENVIPNPLYTLELRTGDPATLGEYVPLPHFVDAFNDLRSQKGYTADGELSQERIRTAWMGNWPGLSYGLALDENANPDGDLAAMLGAIRAHWRQTFRLNQRWVDRIWSLEALRAAVVDPRTLTRAKSPVFTNYVQKLSQAGLNSNTDGRLGFVQSDWAADLSGARSSPFDVQILDADQGIFSVVPRLDQSGLAMEFVIGAPEGDTPSAKADADIAFWHQVTLAADFKMSTILTATADSPNDLKRLHLETVTAQEAAAALGFTGELGELLGPDQHEILRLEDARFAWRDGDGDAIKSAFFGELDEPPRDLLTNGPTLRGVALSAAARALLPFLDKWEGVLQLSHLPAVSPTGNLAEVAHTVAVDANGRATSTTFLQFPGTVKPLDAWGALDESTRRTLGRIQPL